MHFIELYNRNMIQIQAINQVSISNSIGSLRLISSLDWRLFVEENSIVEHTLCKDHGGIYSKMDFLTRDRYRHVVEHISKKSGISENEIAKIAIRLADKNVHQNQSSRSHVGYYLIDEGVTETKKAADIRYSTIDLVWKIFRACLNFIQQ